MRARPPDASGETSKRRVNTGVRARGDQRPESDTDIMIEFDPEAPVGVYEYVGIKEYIASLFEGPVDIVDREGLKPYVRPAATVDAIYAF
jgi:predicted nucleotidyltransferase